MRSIIKFFIQHPIILNLCVFLIIGLGFIKLTQTQVTYFPKQRIRFLTVLVPYPGASPSEVETGITKKIEDNLEGIEGIDRVTSTSANSLATVVVELTEASDDKAVLAEVKNAVDKINNFPDRAEPPIIEKVKVKDLAMTLGIRGNLPFSAMKDYADVIEDDLLASSAISEIIVEGLPAEEIAVEVRDNDLQRYQLSFFQVVSAVQKANLETFGGEIKTGSNNISIKANNKKYFAKELSEIIVSADVNGRIVRLKDVADIKDQFADVATGRYIENQQVITLSTFALPSEDILEVASITQSYIENFNKNHSGVYLQVLEDGTIKVNDQINTMVNNGLVGILLVLIVLALFLDRYLAFWVALKIPFAIIGMFLIAGIQGLTINVVSLFGFVLVLGILVDDGVVIGENIYQWAKKKGVTPQKAAIEGTMEMLVPVLISLTTTVVAFSLFFFLPTQTGEFFGEMGFVVVAVLLFAMLESFFFLPAHLAHSRGLKANHTPSFIERFFNRVLNFINEKIYLPTYRTLSIGNRWVAVLTLVLFIVMLGGAFSLVGTGKVGFTFFPNLDDDAVFTELQMKPGTPVEVVQNKLTALEEAVWKVNKEYSKDRTDGQQVVQYVERITGPQPNEGKLKITFLTGEERGISSFVLSNAMRDMSPPMPEAESLVFGIGATLAVFGKPVSVALYSQNMEELRLAKDALKEEMGVRTDIKDISDTDQIGVDEIELELKPQAELLGLNLAQVMAQVRAGFFGEEIQRLQRGSDEVKVWVRYPKNSRRSIDQLMEMRINDGRGNNYLLSDIAIAKFNTATLAINRLEGKREIRVEANVANAMVSAPAVIGEIETQYIPKVLANYPSVSYSIEGQSRESAKLGATGAIVGPIVLLFIFALIILNFNSLYQAIIVFSLFPFALTGVILGHYLQAVPLNVFSFIGTIALIGVFVNNSLVFISTLNQHLKAGIEWKNALIETASSRFRPILLTTVTTVAGLAPLIASNSVGAQFLKGPAISISYGLVFGLLNILILLPALLHLFNGFRITAFNLFRKDKLSAEQVEPAVRSLRYQMNE